MSLSFSGQALAESVSFEGRAFQVDKVETLPGDQVSVQIRGRSFLVSSSELGQKVFRVYAEEPQLLPEKDINTAYGSFVAAIAAKGSSEGAKVALIGILRSGQISESAKALFFSGLVDSPGGSSLLLEAVRGLGEGERERQSVCSALSFIPTQSFGDVQRLLSSDLSWAIQICPSYLVKKAQQELISGDKERAMSDLSFVVKVFEGRSDAARAAHISYDRLLTINDSIATNNFSKFDAALQGGDFDPLLRDYFQRAQGDLVTMFCEGAAQQKHFGSVLQGLSVLDFSERNNRHHELALEAIRQVQISDLTLVDASSVRKMLWAYAAKDPEIKEAYITTLTGFIERLVDDGYPDKAEALLRTLIDVRTDPSRENDLLRGMIAERFVDMSDFPDADRLLGQLRSPLPWVVRFRLLLKSDTYVLIMVLLGLVVVIRWVAKYLYRLKKSPVAETAQVEEAPEIGEEPSSDDTADEHRFKFAEEGLSKPTYKGLDEYNDCLEKLQLDRGATLADIKNAYRAIVKSLHPDMNPKATRSDLDKFIDLTMTYERLLVLHEERQKKDSPSPE